MLGIIKKNNLQSVFIESDKTHNYDNKKAKNFTGGILIKIDSEKLTIQGSIHKYFNYLKTGKLENYNTFTMQDFTETIDILFENLGVKDLDFLLIDYEIGLNIFLENNEPIDFLKKVKSIGNLDGSQKKLYINPKYKNERFICTQMHRDNTVVFRMYDKNFERLDKGKKNTINPCIRIETLRSRQKKVSFIDFCKPTNLILLQMKFFAEWNKLNFDKEVHAPAGTHQSKKNIAKKIIQDGQKIAMQDIEDNRNQLTPKIYKTIKSFIKHWDENKHGYSLIPAEISPKWDYAYNSAIQLVTKSNTKN